MADRQTRKRPSPGERPEAAAERPRGAATAAVRRRSARREPDPADPDGTTPTGGPAGGPTGGPGTGPITSPLTGSRATMTTGTRTGT
ncbi:hypothetical protein GTY54_01990, partial [Streptomyces sp. SID625]|nr:hypothetical protein [Streptomyces sp. SID625]